MPTSFLLAFGTQAVFASTDTNSSNGIYLGLVALLAILLIALVAYANKQKKSTEKQLTSLKEQSDKIQEKYQTLSQKNTELTQEVDSQKVEISTLAGNKRELEQILVAKIKEFDTIQREVAEKEEMAQQQIQQAEVLQDSFYIETIHEMRTPLSLVLGSLSLAMQSDNPQEEMSTQLLSAYRNTLAMQDLADQLIGTRHANDTTNHLRIAQYDIVEITRQSCDLFVDWIAMNNVDFTVTAQEESIQLWFDRRKMEYALRTLLGNALKNTFTYGKVRLEVSLEVHHEISYCTISVQDEGLDENESTRRGLKQVEEMMEDLGGLFRRDTTPNGTTFSLYIPTGKKHLMEKRVEFVEEEGDLIKLNLKQKEEIAELIQIIPQKKETGKRLLMIDDSDQIRWFLRHVFSKEYQVLEARNGEEGVQIAKQEKPDLILCDVMMPIKDGYTACREIKSDPQTSQIPIVMLTAKVESEDVIKGIESGADDYITKPFDVEILRSKVNSMLRRRDQMKHFYSRTTTTSSSVDKPDHHEEAEQENKHLIPTNPFMEAVIKNIEKHLDDSTFEAKVLADSLNMSLPTLYRKIKQYSDCSILELTRMIRLRRAAELIQTQQHSIQEVSEMVGFNDTATFRKRFTEQYGVTPSQYGQKNGN